MNQSDQNREKSDTENVKIELPLYRTLHQSTMNHKVAEMIEWVHQA